MTKQTQNQEQKQEFNYFEFLKFQVLKAYFTSLFKGEKTNEITFTVKHLDSSKNAWFYKNGAFKFISWHSTFDENGRELIEIKIKDINLDAIAKSKEGKEFKIFNSLDISKAVKSAHKALA